MGEMGKRAAPAEIEPIIHGGVRYTVPHFASLNEGMEHNGGYVEATDMRTDKRIWLKEVYRPGYRSGLERDVQDVFITSMSLEGDKLVIIDEEGRRFDIPLKP